MHCWNFNNMWYQLQAVICSLNQNLMISIARTCTWSDFEWIAKELRVKIVFHPPYFKLCDIFTSAGMWYLLNIFTLSKIFEGTSVTEVVDSGTLVVVAGVGAVVVGSSIFLIFLCTRTIRSSKVCLEGWSSGWKISSMSSITSFSMRLTSSILPCFLSKVVPPSSTLLEVTTSVPNKRGFEVKNWKESGMLKCHLKSSFFVKIYNSIRSNEAPSETKELFYRAKRESQLNMIKK